QTAPKEFSPLGTKSESRVKGRPWESRSLRASATTSDSNFPPPIVPTVDPSARTSIRAVVSRGVEPTAETTVAIARRPCCSRRPGSSVRSRLLIGRDENRISQKEKEDGRDAKRSFG